MSDYQIFSTTADVGLKICGASMADLFMQAVSGLHELVFECQESVLANQKKKKKVRFSISGDSYENLLVKFLSEWLFYLYTYHQVWTEIEIHCLDDGHLVLSCLLLQSDLRPQLEIKSVTYHNLKIEQNNANQFFAAIVFDV
jgi:SHS2 domain-containing protein